jgi:sulfite reductase (ferredoxin)
MLMAVKSKDGDNRPYAKTLLDTNMDTDLEYKNTAIEGLKLESNYLRGNLIEEFDSDVNQNIPDLMMQLLKYHGSYQQNDREWKKNGWTEK